MKHHKRRLVSTGMVADVTRVLAPGGVLRLATDWLDYAQHMLTVTASCPELHNPHGGFAPRFEDRPPTKFERKGLAAGREVHDLELVARRPATDVRSTL